jgi:hypothetical protein
MLQEDKKMVALCSKSRPRRFFLQKRADLLARRGKRFPNAIFDHCANHGSRLEPDFLAQINR